MAERRGVTWKMFKDGCPYWGFFPWTTTGEKQCIYARRITPRCGKSKCPRWANLPKCAELKEK